MAKLPYGMQRMLASVLSLFWMILAACCAGSIAGDYRVGWLVAMTCLWFGAELGELGCTIGEALSKEKNDDKA